MRGGARGYIAEGALHMPTVAQETDRYQQGEQKLTQTERIEWHTFIKSENFTNQQNPKTAKI